MQDNQAGSKVVRNIRIIACRHVIERERPVLYMAFFEDGEVQCDCGSEFHSNSELTKDDYKPIGINHIVEYDQSILDISPLELGSSYERKHLGSQWIMSKMAQSD